MRRNLSRDIFWMIAVAFVLLRLAGVEPWVQSVDAYAYWTTRNGDPYAAAAVGTLGAYLYSPAFAQLMTPLVALPWQLFVAAWTTLNIVVYYRLVGPRLALPLLLFLPIPFEIISGNVFIIIAAVIVYGFRYSGLWSFVLLTKVTPGVGLLWFAVRREWRALLLAFGTTAAIVAVSWVLAPDLWRRWFETLTANSLGPGATPGWYLPVPLLWRLPVAAAIVVWAALTDRRWALPIAVTLALPVVWLNGLAILVAIVPLAGWEPMPAGSITPRRTETAGSTRPTEMSGDQVTT